MRKKIWTKEPLFEMDIFYFIDSIWKEPLYIA